MRITKFFAPFVFFATPLLYGQEVISENPFIASAVFPNFDLDTDSISIVSWNVEHFTDAIDNPYIKNRMEDSSRVTQEKLELFVNVLISLNADVVVLQEFESVAFAKSLADHFFPELNYHYFSSSESPDWYMNIVVMSKIPLGISQNYGAVFTRSTYERDSLTQYYTQAHLNNRIVTTSIFPSAEFEIILTGVHLKAGRSARDTAVRLSQIELIKGQHERLVAQNKKAGLLWVGDFNATPTSVEIQAAKKGKKRTRLIDGLPAEDFSHPADEPTWRLDYILYNSIIEKRMGEGDIKIVQPLSPIEMRQISDHLPVRLQLYWK